MEYNVIVSFIGYKSSTQSVVIGEDNVNVDFELTIDTTLTDVEVLHLVSLKPLLPYTNVSKEEMEIRLGSQDIPLILNTTPSVYLNGQGGGG